MFPQWYVWELALHSLRNISNDVRIQKQIGVTGEELKLLVDEVQTFNKIREKTGRELEQARTAAIAQGQKEDQIRDATHVVNLSYRYKILEGRQRIIDRLPPTHFARLRVWIDQVIKGTTVRLSGRALRDFQQPW